MKIIYMTNNSNDVLGLLSGVKSRITTYLPVLTLLIMLMVGVGDAWGIDEYVTIEDFSGSKTFNGTDLDHVSGGTFTNSANHVTFTISSLSKYNLLTLVYPAISSYPGQKTSNFSWSVAANYDATVTGISIGLIGYQSTTKTKPANAYFSSGSTNGTSRACQTNGASSTSVSISIADGLSKPTVLNMSTTKEKPTFMGFPVNTEFAISSVTYTYRVTHKEYLFGFSAFAHANDHSYGNVSASVATSLIQAGVGETSASTTATFTATPNDGYAFEGWYTDDSYAIAKRVSTNATYQTPLENNEAGSTSSMTLYAKFVPVTVNSVASYTSTLNFTQPGNASTTIKFNVSNADATADFTYSLTGELRAETNGGWVVDSWSYSNNQISIKLKYYCTKYTAQSSDLVNHKATITLTSKAANGTSQSADVYANVNLTPSLSVSPTSKAFGEFTLANDPVQTQTFTFSFNNLNSPADNVVLVTAPTAPFSASWTASETNTKTLTVSFNPTEVGSWNQQIVVEARNSQTPYIATPCTISVSGSAKRNNVTYICNLDTIDGYYVEDDDLNLATLWTSNNTEVAPKYEIVSFTPFGSIHEGAHRPQISGTTLNLGQAGTLVLKLSQPQTTSFNKKDETKTITIHKRPNEIKDSYKWKDDNNATNWDRSLGFEDGAYVQFRSNNMEAGAPHIVVSLIDGEDVATFYPDSVTHDANGDAIYTSFTVGTATWTVSQPENYKYCAAAERQFNLTVGESDCNCVLDEWSWTDDLLHNPPTASEHDVVTFSGIGETLSFDARKNLAAGNQLKYKFYTNDQWSEATQITTETNYKTFGPYQLGEEDNNTTAVQFMKGSTLGYDTDDPFINHIIVTRKRWMKLKATSDATATILSLDKLQRKVGTAEKTATFYVDFSTCSAKVKVASNHGNVTFANGLTKDTISTNTTGKTGYNAVVPVTIHYSSDTIESKTVTITVYTEDKNATLTIPVQTTGIETELVYIGNASYPVNNANIAATSLFAVREKGTANVVSGAAITISGSNEAAEVVANALNPLCGDKSANISASFAGDNRHEPCSLTNPQTIAITKINDAVTFNSHPMVYLGKSYDISTWASANAVISSYISGDNTIFSISGTTLTAHAVGTTTLTATTAGDACTYISGATNSESITVQPGYIFIGTKDNQWEDNSNWVNGEKPTGTDDVIIRGNLVIDDEIEVNSMTIENTGSVTLSVTGSLTVNGNSPVRSEGYGDLHVLKGGEVALNGQLKVRNFILDAQLGDMNHQAASGQVNGEDKLDINGDAYFQISFDPRGAIDYGWYDFTVPFEVDVLNGVFDKNGNKLTNNVDYAVMSFSEEKRAANGKAWTWFSGTLQPGRLYSITLEETKTWNTFLFKRKSSTAHYGSNTYGASYTNNGETTDRGWNGLGNGTLQHCQLNSLPAQTKIQVYDHTNDRYVEREADEYTYAVGTAFFVQVDKVKDIDLTAVTETRGFLAPKRNQGRTFDEFRLALTEEGSDNVADHLWVSASEEATGDYVIGHDLLKMGTPTSAKVAQMWAVNNSLTLCDIEMPLVSEEANCALGLFAPKAGSYELAIERAPEDADLYLTFEDRVIWDLTASPYVFDLTKGTTTGYGLRIEAKRAPQITTGMDNTDAAGQTMRKVIIDNKVYIVTPEGRMYDIVGKSVKY